MMYINECVRKYIYDGKLDLSIALCVAIQCVRVVADWMWSVVVFANEFTYNAFG